MFNELQLKTWQYLILLQIMPCFHEKIQQKKQVLLTSLQDIILATALYTKRYYSTSHMQLDQD